MCKTSPDVLLSWDGFLKAIHLPSFPFPGRDLDRRINFIEGTFHRNLSSPEEKIQRKPSDLDALKLPSRPSFGMERNEPKDIHWENRITVVPPVPVGTPRMRNMEDPSLLGTTNHL
jgi:hypothetical protein